VPTVFDHPTDLLSAVGTDLGHTDWLEITQERVQLFADATGDHQWIHVDPERARNESPFGGPIAHGYLTLALTNLFLPQLIEVRGISMGVNYGADKVRFPAPVLVGSRVRGAGELIAATEIPGGVQTTIMVRVEIEGGEKPACVVESVSRWMAEA
jgi:acyl dehydratase